MAGRPIIQTHVCEVLLLHHFKFNFFPFEVVHRRALTQQHFYMGSRASSPLEVYYHDLKLIIEEGRTPC